MNHKNLILVLIIFLGIQFQGNAQPISAEKRWATADILTTSESVCYNTTDHSLFVSCINGNPVDKDGNGFIAKVSLSGDIIMQKWAKGLNAPKGMAIFKDHLYVTDIDRIAKIDLQTGTIIEEFPVVGAKFLNDIVIDPLGNIYFTDMASNKIHSLYDGQLELWFENEAIKSPNGLDYENNDILVGTKDGIFAIRIDDQKFWHLVKNTGGIDGLKADGLGNYIISDWMGKVQFVNTEDEPFIILNTSDQGINAADFEYIADQNMLIIPTFSDNRVVAYEIFTIPDRR